MFESCREFEDQRRYIVCEEKRTKITFCNSTGEKVAKFRIDGCVISDNTVKKCDYLLLCDKIKKAVFVELKGTDVKTAIEQLSATLDNETVKTPLARYEKRAYAVVTRISIPSIPGTKSQTEPDKFNKRHKGCKLRVVRSSHTYDFMTENQVNEGQHDRK